MRVGYLVGPAEKIATLAKRANETYISPNMLAESIVFELCRSGGMEENLKVVNAALSERCDALVKALREHIPEAEFVVPEGGYFLWLSLNEDVDSTALLAEAKEEGVTFVAGPDFMLEGGTSSLRLSFAPVPAERRRRGDPAPRARPPAPAGGQRPPGGLDPAGPGSPGRGGTGSGPRPASGRACGVAHRGAASIALAIDTRRRSAMFRSVIKVLVLEFHPLSPVC